jgi:hypothetical protein
MAEFIENCLQLGMIVDALNYILDETFEVIDPTKISYNDYYSSPDFILSKFDKNILQTDYMIPVLDAIIQSKQGQTPLEEIQKIYNLNNINK